MADSFKSFLVSGLCLLIVAAFFGCNQAAQEPAAAIPDQSTPKKNSSGDATKTAREPKADPNYPEVLVETSLGNFRIRLDGKKSPLTVDNFLNYVESGHYDQTIVHQVYQGQGVVAGGYGTNYAERDTRTPVRNEAENGLKNLRGTISMVRYPDVIDSATCQFFINVSDNPALDHKSRTSPEEYGYCVFGEVIEGMDVVDRINQVNVKDMKGTVDLDQTPANPVIIKSIRRTR